MWRLPAATAGLAAFLLVLSLGGACAQQTSDLWGSNGERWTPTSPIPDLSFAGYNASEGSFPTYNLTFNVIDYGAKPDDSGDDSTAFLLAIAAASQAAYNLTTQPCSSSSNSSSILLPNPAYNVTARCPMPNDGFGNGGRAGAVVYIPAGRFIISRMLEITQSDVVVKGAGVNKTVLHFPLGLKRIYGNQMEWQWSGGFMVIVGPVMNSTHTAHKLASIMADAPKGSRRLTVSSTQGMRVGQWVRLWAERPLQARNTGRRLLEAHKEQREGRLQADWARREEVRRNERRLSQGPFVPLSPAMEEARRQAEALGLGLGDEHSEHPEHDGWHSQGGRAKAGRHARMLRQEGDEGGGASAASASGTLDAYIYGENVVPSGRDPFPFERIRFASRIARIGDGWVDLERPLIYDLRAEWQPAVHSFQQAVQHSGFEDFTVDFAWSPYPKHFQVEGFNGFYFAGAANCWVRNVHIINADTGGEAINSDFITMSDITLTHTAPRAGKRMRKDMHGHHGLWAAHSSNVLIDRASIQTKFIHDLTLDVWAQECVIRSAKGLDLNTDMHRGGSHNNLWSNIHVGLGTRPFASSGFAQRGAHAAANNTWWNIQSDQGPVFIPPCGFGPLLTFVARDLGPPDAKRSGAVTAEPPRNAFRAISSDSLTGTASIRKGYCRDGVSWWVEVTAGGTQPEDLHAAMRDTRTARLGVV